MLDRLSLGAAERERDDVRALSRDDIELRLPLVVAPFRGADGHAVAIFLLTQAACVVGDRGLVGLVARRVEEVDAERAGRRRAHRRDLPLHRRCGLVSGGEEAEAAGLGDCGDELRRRRAAGHRSSDNRHVE